MDAAARSAGRGASGGETEVRNAPGLGEELSRNGCRCIVCNHRRRKKLAGADVGNNRAAKEATHNFKLRYRLQIDVGRIDLGGRLVNGTEAVSKVDEATSLPGCISCKVGNASARSCPNQ